MAGPRFLTIIYLMSRTNVDKLNLDRANYRLKNVIFIFNFKIQDLVSPFSYISLYYFNIIEYRQFQIGP